MIKIFVTKMVSFKELPARIMKFLSQSCLKIPIYSFLRIWNVEAVVRGEERLLGFFQFWRRMAFIFALSLISNFMAKEKCIIKESRRSQNDKIQFKGFKEIIFGFKRIIKRAEASHRDFQGSEGR